ncbi:MAG: hypothetical protein DI637_03195 [Citromicrobium sp.]|nr:MAG: hypothetical protein DI637_03195 [Citromicrobium sp.]
MVTGALLAACAPAEGERVPTDAALDAMLAAALMQEPPLDDREAVCLSASLAPGEKLNDPPASALRAFARLTDLPILPGSQCGFDVYPFVIASGAKAMIYTVEVEAVSATGEMTFWGHATFGNLGAKGQQFVLRKVGEKWVARPTGVSVIS